MKQSGTHPWKRVQSRWSFRRWAFLNPAERARIEARNAHNFQQLRWDQTKRK